MKKTKLLQALFFTMLKIGAFTFGGGIAMLALLENEFVSKRGWLDREEFLDMVAISESTPGPIAINSATYIGYKMAGFAGSLLATLGVCIPSFAMIYLISLFFYEFLSFEYVQYAFMGIRVAVVFLILSAGVKLFKGIRKNLLSVSLLVLTVGMVLVSSLFSVSFSAVLYILIGGAVGFFAYSWFRLKKRNREDET
ncbi:MAG: chromate transporter [Clostridia bacterium]|nr:chromate transporter [Clostridia bacterium]